MHALEAVALLPFGRRLHAHLVWPVAEAPVIVARKPVGRDLGLGGDVLVGEALERRLIIVVSACARRTRPSVSLATSTIDFPPRFPPTKASSI